MEAQSEPAWVRSSFCDSSACVEVAFAKDVVLVRDSKSPGGPVLAFPEDAWRSFLAGVRLGDFKG